MHKYSLSILALFSLMLLGSCTGFFSANDKTLNTSPYTDQVTHVDQQIIQTSTSSSLDSYTPFHKPNLEWKTRTITLKDGRTLTYVFGEGNPREVALTREQMRVNCNSSNQNLSFTFLHGDCLGSPSGIPTPIYITPEVESHLLDALSDTSWKEIFSDCQQSFRWVESQWNMKLYYYDYMFSQEYLDINNFIFIDSETGRKRLDYYRTQKLIDDLNRATIAGGAHNTAGGLDNPYGSCIEKYASGIVKNLEFAGRLYLGETIENIQGSPDFWYWWK